MLGLILDNDDHDDRDVYTALAIFNNAAERISVSFEELCQNIMPYSTPQRAAVFSNFIEGPRYMRSFESMGLAIVTTDNGDFYAINRL